MNPPAPASRGRHGFAFRLFLGVACLAFAGGCTWFSPRPRGAMRGMFNHQPHAGPVGSETFEKAMDRHTHAPLSRGNRLTLLQNGEEAFPAMLAAIRGARRRISMETYIVERDRTTDEFFAALAEAAARGVEVRFVADAVGFRRGQIASLAELDAAGVRTRVFNPLLASWTILRFNNRDHRKILVVDGRTAFVGGINLSDEQAGDGVTGWRDTAAMVEGPAALEAERVFAASWRQGGRGYFGRDWPFVGTRGLKRALDWPVTALGNALGVRDDFSPSPPGPEMPEAAPASTVVAGTAWAGRPPDAADASARVVWTDPVECSAPMYEAMLLALNGATESVDIATAYFAPPRALRKAIAGAAERGVKVRLLLPGVTDVMLARPVSEGFYAGLLAAGVEIYEWPHYILHSKTMVVDRRWSLVGSANLDSRSLALSYEASLAVSDAAFGAAMGAAFDRDVARARRVTGEEWDRRGPGNRVRDSVLVSVGGQF